MSIIPSSIKATIFSLFFLGIIVAGFALWLTSQPSIEQVSLSERDEWQLPVLKQKNDAEFFEKLRTHSLWQVNENNENGDNTDKIEKNVSQADWQLLGIVYEGQMQYALLQDKSTKIQRYKTGDSLDEGVQLMAIYQDYIEIKKAEENIIKDLYAKTLGEMPKIEQK
jgi:hypothetical protein